MGGSSNGNEAVATARRRRWSGPRALATALLPLLTLAWWLTCLPDPLFRAPYATVIEAADGTLLSARIAADEQWRFPGGGPLDRRYVRCVELFEDEYFRWHPGVNPGSVLRALRQNWRAGRVVSGGSTITQQTVRLMRGDRARTPWEKLVEVAWATRLELTHSKEDILTLYATHAPFGGNVVGVAAAAWRYYGRAATHLSWGEAAALAVLPNAPGVIYPGRSDAALRRKRDGLLDKLHARGDLDAADLALAKLEPLPGAPHPLPDLTPQLTLPEAPFRGQQTASAPTPRATRTTLDAGLQRAVTDLVEGHRRRHAGNGVHNACAVVADVTTGAVLAYVGNAPGAGGAHEGRVDVLQAPRSSGSTLKPFLYAGMLDAGAITPRTLLPDVPTLIGEYAPRNFDHAYDGAVPAAEALTRSLNVPWVRALRGFGVGRLLGQLRRSGLSTLSRSADDYGLSLILGGGEVTALGLAGAYRGLARTVQTYHASPRRYTRDDWAGLRLRHGDAYGGNADPRAGLRAAPVAYSAAAAYLTLETLTELERPGDLAAWRSFGGSRRVAWKTGTSFGMRDAWAVGVTPEYVAVVWVGNADGEGRPGLTGASAAAPLLFDVFGALPPTTWFEAPTGDMVGLPTCVRSGRQAGPHCPAADTLLLPAAAPPVPPCRYHERVYVDAAGRRVDNTCAELSAATAVSAFALPPRWAGYYRRRHPDSVGAPDWAPDCAAPSRSDDAGGEGPMAVVYPRAARAIHLPRDLAGERQAITFEIAHEAPDAELYWYLDGALVAVTDERHERALRPAIGPHQLLVVDERGRELRYGFLVE